jgi:hypothetical protein
MTYCHVYLIEHVEYVGGVIALILTLVCLWADLIESYKIQNYIKKELK